MKHRFLVFTLLFLNFAFSSAQTFDLGRRNVLRIKHPQVPVLIERQDNALLYFRIDAEGKSSVGQLEIEFSDEVSLREIKSLTLYYGGTEARQDSAADSFYPVNYLSAHKAGRTLSAEKSYSVELDRLSTIKRKNVFSFEKELFEGVNYFWISVRMKPCTSLSSKLRCRLSSLSFDGKTIPLESDFDAIPAQKMAVGVRHAGDDGVESYRIPGLVTTNKGTLIAVYDVRYNSSNDLQEHIDIGLSRSTDGGRSWQKMRIPLSFGQTGGLPQAQNGVGDPCILYDDKSNTLWIAAAWTHGMGNKRAWWSSYPGMDKESTAQLVLSKSVDDGKTWSEPINITQQVKDPSWYFLLQGPGRGITMQDGTLVFPVQFIGADRIPCAGIMYSKDAGSTWHIHSPARTNTTESQVAEIEPGVLMLNMRDNRGGSRAVSTTADMGKSWQEHESSRKALVEPVCMASLLSVRAEDNITGKDILIFSNPDSEKSRNNITVKISLDGGITWPQEYQLLLDENETWGYSCLTMLDEDTIGILYESCVAEITFQTISLSEMLFC